MVWPTDFDPRLSEYAVTDYTEAKANTKLDHLIGLDIHKRTSCTRLTGIMATIGPTSKDLGLMEQMMAAGMNMARLNCAFEKRVWRGEVVRMLRRAAAQHGRRMGRVYPLAIALDLRGPVVRTGFIDPNLGGQVQLVNGELIQLTTDRSFYYTGSQSIVYVNFQRIAEMVQKGDVIFLNKRRLRLRVESVSKNTVTCSVEAGGTLVSHRDISLEDAVFELPTFSLQDEQDVQFAIENQVDIIIASYVHDASTIRRLRQLLGEKGKKIAIVCKVQNAKGLNNLDELLEVSDSIILSRQELATETDPVKLVIVQKHITARAMVMGKPCGVFAQVLESLSHAHMPLRSELLDAGACVLDGADYLLLSTESSWGPQPVGAVAALAGALREAESCLWFRQLFIDLVDQVRAPCSPAEATAMAAALAAHKAGAAFVVVVASEGRPAQLVARYRPRCPVLAVTRHARVARRLHICRGVVPLIYDEDPDSDWKKDIGKRINFCLQFGFDHGFLKVGDPVVVVSGWQEGSAPNSLRVVYAREMEPSEHIDQTA